MRRRLCRALERHCGFTGRDRIRSAIAVLKITRAKPPKKSDLLKSGGKHLLMCCHLSVALLCCVGFSCAAHHLYPNSLVNIVDGVGPSRVGWLFSDCC